MSKKTHGLSKEVSFRVWNDMMFRCYNKKSKSYKNYGARGIGVEHRWHDFLEFFKDMGNPTKGHSIDRIDNNKGYSKENCRWVSTKENLRNRRNNRLVKINGHTKTIAEWADLSGLNFNTIAGRIRSKNYPKDKLLAPSRSLGSKNQYSYYAIEYKAYTDALARIAELESKLKNKTTYEEIKEPIKLEFEARHFNVEGYDKREDVIGFSVNAVTEDIAKQINSIKKAKIVITEVQDAQP